MATGSVNVTANVTGGPDGSSSFNSSRPIPTALQAETVVALIIGSVTVTVPTGSTDCIIVPPNAAVPVPNPSYGGTITLKGVAGDTGVPISTTYATRIPWDLATVPASFVLTASATGTCQVKFY